MGEDELIKDKLKVSVPQRRRERVLILSVEPTVEEEKVLDGVENLVEELKPDLGVSRDLLSRLQDPALANSTVKLLEELYVEGRPKIRVIRKINTKAGKKLVVRCRL